MVFKNYYKILNLETSNITVEEIKIAYRAAAKKYHPDLNIGDALAEEKIKNINEAYKVLSVPATKRKYDRVWNSKFMKKQKAFSGSGQKGAILSMFFGKTIDEDKEKQQQLFPVKGDDVETSIVIDIKDAFQGNERKLMLKSVEGKNKTITINIPEGIRNGEKIRLIGQGKEGRNGGRSGDLFIKIKIENNNDFELKGHDIHTKLYLTPWEAALGTRVNVKSIDDETKVYIPNGVQSGEKIKIPGKGYRIDKDKRGDLVANIHIMVPKQLSDEEKRIFEEIQNVSTFNPRTI